MKSCDTCGQRPTDAYLLGNCPRCLFAAALASTEGPLVPVQFPREQDLCADFDLCVRRDFYRRYGLLQRIAQGGQADVWKVWDFACNQHLALKRLEPGLASSGLAVSRFLAEAQITRLLEHPGILPVFDVGRDSDGRPFYTMPLFPGATLRRLLLQSRRGSPPQWRLVQALNALARVCEIMAHAHRRGVVHQDLKPSNVLVDPSDDVRVIDWGSADFLKDGGKDIASQSDMLCEPLIRAQCADTERCGLLRAPDRPAACEPITMLYVPPEVLVQSLANTGPETDIYSVGVMLYELLAGIAPYCRADGTLPGHKELRRAILKGPPPPVCKLNPKAPPDMAAICQRAMAFRQMDRYHSMEELAEALRAALEVQPARARRQKWRARSQ